MAAKIKPISGKIQCDGTVLFGPDDFTPDWDNIPEPFNTVGIEPCGTEYAFRCIRLAKPLSNWENEPADKIKTGRKFDMSEINWKETLSERPKK
jgi:hypothetical protein